MKPTISSWFLSVPVYLDRAKVNPCLKNYLFCDHDMPDLNCKIMQPPPKNGHVLAENQNRFVAAEPGSDTVYGKIYCMFQIQLTRNARQAGAGIHFNNPSSSNQLIEKIS